MFYLKENCGYLSRSVFLPDHLIRSCKTNEVFLLTLYRMVMPIGTPFLKEKINN